MHGSELEAARLAIGERAGLTRGLTAAELARVLDVGGQRDPGARVRIWERAAHVPGEVAAFTRLALVADRAVLRDLLGLAAEKEAATPNASRSKSASSPRGETVSDDWDEHPPAVNLSDPTPAAIQLSRQLTRRRG